MMLTQDNHEPVQRAIAAVEQERQQLVGEIKKLQDELEIKQQRFSQLTEFIQKGKALLGLGLADKKPVPIRRAYPHPPIIESKAGKLIRQMEDLGLIEKPVLQGAIEILTEFGRPMQLSEIAKEFYKRKWKLSEKNGREVLRFTLKKKVPDLIIKMDDGRYGIAVIKNIQ
jgi:hypothetical protein